ncbi:MAG TPA: hypothetical protein VFI31_20350, partial [Pirellulales bacterium]|nr:hypothetical protein [Pirellulales bacterium]
MPAPPLKANTGYVSPTDLDAVIRETDWEAFQAFPRTDCEYETFKGLLRDEETRLKMVELLTSTPPHLDQFRALFSEDMATLDAPLIRTLKTEASKKDDGNLTDIRVGNGKKRPYRPKNRMNCRLKAWFDWRALSGPPQQRFELVFGEPTNDGFCTVSVVWQPIAYDATATRIPGIPVGRLPRKSEPAWAVVIELRCLGELNTEIQSELWNTFHEIHDPPRARAARIPKASETADPSREFHRNPKSVLNDSGDNEGANADTWDYRGLPDGLSATLPLGDNGCVRQKVTDAVRFARLLSDLPALKAQKTTIAVDLCDVRGLQREVDGQLLGWRRNVARAAVLASHLAEEQAAEARIRKMSAKIERQFQKKLDELRNGRVIDGGTAGKIRLTEDALSKCMHEAVAENPTCLQFVKMHGALDDEPSSCLLVTAQVERIIRHWYSCEPVGVIDDTTVHRVWCRTAALRDNEIDNYVDSRLPDGECAPIVDVDVSDEQAALAAQSAVPYSASIDTNVLLWRCDRNRKFDLLTPVTESLRDLFDLRDYSTDSIKSRINDFSESAVELLELARWTWTGGEKLVNPVSAGYGQQPQEISGIDQLRSLLIGSKFDGNFRNIVNVLYNLLFHFNKHDLRIVVSNPQHADELTARLLKLLMDAAKGRHLTLLAKPSEKTAKLTIVLCGQHGFGRSTEVLPFEWSKAGEQDDPHRTPEEFPKVVIDRLLLQIASVLGVSFLRDWLRRVAKRMGVSDDGFRLALARLVEAGVLRYSGYLRDPGEEKRRFRELSFSSSSVFETIRGSVEQQDQNEVRQAFLAEVLDKIVNHGIDTVRHKIRVCEILGGTANGRGTEDIVKALLGEVGAKALAELWWMAGSRARHAGAPIEAMKRLMNASHLIRAFNLQQNATTRRLALRVLVHRVAVCEDRIAESDDPDSMQQAKRDAMQQLEDARQSRITFGKANDLDLDEENGLFALHRRCWSYHNRHGSLSEAKDWAQSLLDRSNSGVFSDNRLKLELRHILCVVS